MRARFLVLCLAVSACGGPGPEPPDGPPLGHAFDLPTEILPPGEDGGPQITPDAGRDSSPQEPEKDSGVVHPPGDSGPQGPSDAVVGDASPDARADASIPAPRDAGCPDSDSDGVCDGRDTCPGYDDTADRDGDGVPDDCDDYPDGGSANDLDGDGVANEFDICPAGPDADNNGDGIPDGCGQVLAIVTWEGQEPVGTNYLFAVEMPGKIVIYDPTGLRAPGSEPGIKTWLRDTNSSTAEGASRLDNWSGDLHAALAVSSNPRDLSPPASWTAATVTGFRVDLIQTSPTLRFQWQVLGYR